MVRRVLDRGAGPRALAWVDLSLLTAIALAVFGLLAFLVMYLAPHSLAQKLGIGCVRGDHCLHGLPVWAQWTLWTTVTALLVLLLGRAAWTLFSAIRAGRRARRFALALVGRDRAVTAGRAAPLCEVEDEGVLACTVGFFRPLILISSGMRDSLRTEEFEAVIAHERAHVVARDNLVLLIARTIDTTLFFIPGVRTAYRGLRRSLEVAADARAAEWTGDPLLVAGSLGRVARLTLERTRPRPFSPVLAGTFFVEDDLVIERLEHLIADRPPVTSRRRLLGAAVALLLVFSVMTTSAYLVTEQNLGSGSEAALCATTSAD